MPLPLHCPAAFHMWRFSSVHMQGGQPSQPHPYWLIVDSLYTPPPIPKCNTW